MSVRIDKWLWAARFFKTRSLAKTAVEQGKVKLNGQKCKPARAIEINDTLLIRKAGMDWEISVQALSDRRGPAKVAQTLYIESEDSIKNRESQISMNKISYQTTPRPDTKPSKKQRRDLNRLKDFD
ncbi:RNA-binding S4 domain-containing protein [Marinicella sp. W31]|uniref:RNA-binding S4 domain-containing protein n=1 Tax=Marinicella sp. W31 TaxID=3023713 RepID=UPI0037565565